MAVKNISELKIRITLVFLPGLLALLLLFPLQQGAAQDAAGSLMVLVETRPDRPAAGEPWTLVLLVDHPRPSEVTVRPPRFPPNLILERVRTEGRFVSVPMERSSPAAVEAAAPGQTPAGRIWTVVEFLFTPEISGEFVLEPFRVSVTSNSTPPDAGREAEIPALNLVVRAAPGRSRRSEPVFRWENPPAALAVGEAGDLNLLLMNWDPAKPPPNDLFSGSVPLNAILEEQGREGERYVPVERYVPAERTISYRLRLIPLNGPELVLGPRQLRHESVLLTIPRLAVKVKPAPVATPASAAVFEPEKMAPGADPALFAAAANINPLFRKDYERIVEKAEKLWHEGQVAEALAELRRAERDRFSGAYIRSLRSGLESHLGLDLTEDEAARPVKLINFYGGLFVALILAIFLIIRRFGRSKKAVTTGKIKGFKGIIILGVGLALILVFSGMGALRPNTAAAVLKETDGRRIPEADGAVSAHFTEGQPVIIRSGRDAASPWAAWSFVETPDGRSGWIKADMAIFY